MAHAARTVEIAARARPRHPRPVDFRRLLGESAWARLPAAVQRRFSLAANLAPHDYVGAMEVRATAFGFVMAQTCRLMGTPLAPWQGKLVPVAVHVYPRTDGALVWDRTYSFAARPPVKVSSAKAVTRDGGLMEIVRGGLGMHLVLSVEDGVIHFRSRRYFITVVGIRLPIPTVLTPGVAHVAHEDVGGGWFRFTLDFVHPLAGETIFQSGLFRDPLEGKAQP